MAFLCLRQAASHPLSFGCELLDLVPLVTGHHVIFFVLCYRAGSVCGAATAAVAASEEHWRGVLGLGWGCGAVLFSWLTEESFISAWSGPSISA